MQPTYTLDDIKFATDEPTFKKAVGIYEISGVIEFKEDGPGYSAQVISSDDDYYDVYVYAKRYDDGSCDCYLGQNYILCKHMVALAIYALKRGQNLNDDEKIYSSQPKCSGIAGELSDADLDKIKKEITFSLRFIKSYAGSSRDWFAYQGSLFEGCNRLTALVDKLPVSVQTSELLVSLLLRLEKKLINGVDDSDGTVGSFIQSIVIVLEDFIELNPECVQSFEKLCNLQTSFGWEDPLVTLYDESLN